MIREYYRKHNRDKPRIYIIGTDESIPGGITQVMQDIINSRLRKDFEFVMIGTAVRKHKLRSFVKGFCRICRDASAGRIDLMHLHMSEGASVYRKCVLLMVGKRYHIPVVLHSHGSNFQTFYEKNPCGIRKLLSRIFCRADCIIALTPGWKAYWDKITAAAEKIVVIPNFVKLPEEIPVRHSDKFQVVFLGRLGKRKGTYDLIEAFHLMEEGKRDKYIVYLAGDGDVEPCRRLIDTYGLKDIFRVTGWIDKQRKRELLSGANVLILPSYYESFGIVLLESMSYGVPVICSNGGYMKEIVRDGMDGIVIHYGSPEEIINALECLEGDPQLCRKYGMNGRERVMEHYCEDKVIGKYEKLYQSLI